MCLYSRLITNRKYTSNKKNGGNIPAVTDIRTKYVPIGCQKCMECKKKKAREWQIRLSEEIKTTKNGIFVTLTFSNESITKLICENKKLQNIEGYDLDNEIATVAVRHWLERWRKKHKKSVRHWLVTELGHEGTENIHLHGIIWTEKPIQEIESTWKYGFVWPTSQHQRKTNYVNGKTVNYIIKYITKADQKHKYYNSKVLTSPGIGNQYTETYNSQLNKYNPKDTNEAYRYTTGHKASLPIYYRNKLYSEEEKEKLWLNKLDQNTRYVGGEKINADDIESYNKLLKWYREKNEQLGYGNDEIDWNRKQYEEQRRIIQNETRIKNAKNKK